MQGSPGYCIANLDWTLQAVDTCPLTRHQKLIKRKKKNKTEKAHKKQNRKVYISDGGNHRIPTLNADLDCMYHAHDLRYVTISNT